MAPSNAQEHITRLDVHAPQQAWIWCGSSFGWLNDEGVARRTWAPRRSGLCARTGGLGSRPGGVGGGSALKETSEDYTYSGA